MFHNLNYTIQETGDHTYSRCVGELLCQLIEIKVRKDTLVMPERLMMSLQLKTLIVQVIKTLMELLDEGGVRWTDGEVCHRDLTNLLTEYQTSDCMEPSPPYTRSKVGDTFLSKS